MQITITNGTLTQIQETLSPASGYVLPNTVTVTGATSDYNSSTGVITLTALTDTMSITATGEPTHSNPNLTDIFTDIANAIRAKTGKSGQLYPVNFANEIATIETGGGGAELNIHYSSTTAPSDTSKLWVKTDTEPEKVKVSKDLALGAETISTLGTTLPTGTADMASGVVGTKIYLFGGYIGSSSYSNKIYRFDSTTGTITTLSATLPSTIYQMASGVVGTKVYLFGGYPHSYKIYRFDSTTGTITTLSATFPTKIDSMASGVVGTKIYLFGGMDGSGNYLNKIYRFDSTTGTTTTLSVTLPTGASGIASGVVGTKIYLFGGYSGNGSRVDTICCFDTTTETLTTLSETLPIRISSMASGVVGTKIYLFGGYNGSRVDTIYCFDTTTERITTLSATLPIGLTAIASGVVGTKIYLFGGNNSSYSSIIYRFTVSFALPEDNLLLLDTGSTSFNLVNSNALVIEAKPKQVYIGDSNDEGEYVESALYANGSWQPIG